MANKTCAQLIDFTIKIIDSGHETTVDTDT